MYLHPAHRRAREVRLHQHRAARPLSRRRPAGGELRARTAGRCRGAGDRHRPHRTCAGATSCRATKSPTPPPVGTRYDSGDFDAVFDKALPPPTWRASPRGARSPSGPASGAGSASPASSSMRAARRATRRPCCFPATTRLVVRLAMHGSGQGHASLYRRLAAERLGIDETRVTTQQGDTAFDLNGMAAIASRSTHHGRQRPGEDRRAGAREGHAHRGAPARSGRSRYRLCRGRVPCRRHRPAHRPVRGGAARAARSARRSTPRAGPRCRRPSPTAATSPRSRSIPTPARSTLARLHRGRRLRRRARSRAGRRPGAGRHRARRRPGPVRGRGATTATASCSRARSWTTRMPRADHAADFQRARASRALHDQSARRQRHRRGRHDRRTRRGDERHHRRAARASTSTCRRRRRRSGAPAARAPPFPTVFHRFWQTST